MGDCVNEFGKVFLFVSQLAGKLALFQLAAATSLSFNMLILYVIEHHLLELFEVILVHLSPVFRHLPLALAQPQHHLLHFLQQPLLGLDLLLELFESAGAESFDLLTYFLTMLVYFAV